MIGLCLILSAGCQETGEKDPEPYESAEHGWLLSTDSFSQAQLNFDTGSGEEYPVLESFKNKIESEAGAESLIFDPDVSDSETEHLKTAVYCWRWQHSDGDKFACFPAE